MKEAFDELCSCGHLKSSHEDSLPGGIAKGHGACRICGCKKFTWVKFVRKEEMQDRMREK